MKKILIFISIFGFLKTNAQDRLFTYTYQSRVLNKAQKEIEVWSTLSTGRKNYFRGLEHRLEFEVGLGGKLQTSFYLNYGYNSAVIDVNGVQSLQNNIEYSFSNEWKLKLSDPTANIFGSALYFEYAIAPTETELEGKFIIDKHTGNFVNAINFVGEYEIEKQFTQNGTKINTENEGELKLEFNYGLSYKVKDNLNIGLEVMNQNQLEEGELESSVLLLGPCFSYSANGFWINFTCMPQITNFKSDRLELTEQERLQTRLVFSYAF
jgi:hypothetical protein